SLPLEEISSRTYSVWYDNQYLGVVRKEFDEGIKLEDIMSNGSSFANKEGYFLWDSKRYTPIYMDVKGGYVPNVSPNEEGGILWLNINGKCFGDGGAIDVSCFSGFNTVIISGNGELEIEGGIECGGGTLALPALIIDGDVELECDSISVTKNDDNIPALFVRNGKVDVDQIFVSGDVLISGGDVETDMIVDPLNVVVRGGEFETEQWGGISPNIILSGGDLTCSGWLPEGTVAYVGKGTMSANGLKYNTNVHVYDDGKIIDLMEKED
ncbi:MAG: hypothetical protein MR695_00005, partial [Solobacterium sp.]|nr:hypothetical protein [Solobacterium sp.]